MNRRANLYLNVIGFTTFMLTLVFFILTMRIEGMTHTNYLLRNTTLALTFISNIIFVSAELLLFVLLQKKYKRIEVISIVLELAIAIYINSIMPYTFMLVLMVCELTKDIIRIVNVRKIYINRRFTTYCRRYGIKINDFKRTYKKKKKTTKKKGSIRIPVPTGATTATAITPNA